MKEIFNDSIDIVAVVKNNGAIENLDQCRREFAGAVAKFKKNNPESCDNEHKSDNTAH
jgi:hypothetical protein